MADTQGFFFPDNTPEQAQLLRQQLLAKQLMDGGQSDQATGAYGGLANAGKMLAGALLSRQLGDKQKELETTREGAYSKALGNFLSPFDYGGAPNADTGIPDNVNVSPQASAANAGQLGSSMGSRLAATGNTDLQRQVAPQVLAQALQANAPLTPYEKANLADRADQRAYERTGADYGTLDQGSSDIQKAMDSSITIPKYQMGIQKGADSAAADANAKLPAEIALAKAKEQAAVHPNEWQILNDKDGTAYRYNASSGQATTLDAKNSYSPQGAAKITSGMPRSPATAAFMKWQSENPNASAADYQQAAGKIAQTVAGGRSIGGGQDGAGILAANAASQHLKVYEDLAQAMNNGDVQAINSAKNRWQQEFGTAAPTNAEFANQIVGPELVKAIVVGGGTGAERQEMEKALSTNKSWGQASGLAATAKRLMGGQLAARQKKFTFNGQGSTDDFRKGLEPEAQNILDQFGGSASALPNAPLAAPGGPKPAAQFRYDANGNRVTQ